MPNFVGKSKSFEDMTAIQLNAMNVELWQSIGAIADNELLMRRLTRYAKKLAMEKKADPTEMTKEEFFARVDKAERGIAEGKGTTFTNREEMNKWLNSL
jgi:hypothetical protein